MKLSMIWNKHINTKSDFKSTKVTLNITQSYRKVLGKLSLLMNGIYNFFYMVLCKNTHFVAVMHYSTLLFKVCMYYDKILALSIIVKRLL